MSYSRRLGSALSLIGGSLITINGAYYAYEAATNTKNLINHLTNSMPTYLSTYLSTMKPYTLTIWFLSFGLAIGLILIYLSHLQSRKNNVTAISLAILALATLSILSGGGFTLGMLLCLLGGMLTITTSKSTGENV